MPHAGEATRVEGRGTERPRSIGRERCRGAQRGWRHVDSQDDARVKGDAAFRALADSTLEMVWLADAGGRLVYRNERWRAFFGGDGPCAPDHWPSFLHPDDIAAHRDFWACAFAGHETPALEVRLKHADGEYRWVRATLEPVQSSVESPVRWCGTLADVHDQKLAHSERELLLDSERAARADAERASRAKDEFVAILGHELRRPLNAILGWTHLLQQPNLDEKARQQGLAVIERNARDQAQLIADLLDASLVIAGKLPLQIGKVDLVQCARAAVEKVRTVDGDRHTWQTQFPSAPVMVRGDGERLRQVTSTLLQNAIKFTPAGGAIVVEVSSTPTAGRVTVRDTGQGIAPTVLPHVFDWHRQRDGSASRSQAGLGLGLAIAQSIVDAHQGGIFAESEGEGRGAVFRFDIPAADAPGGGVPATPEYDVSGIRVLLVDDDTDGREAVGRMLSRAGAVVITADSVEAALKLVATEPPDVIVSDIGMPRVDGYEFLRRLRAHPPLEGGKVPAVALTAFVRDRERAAARRAGFNAHLAKPLRPEQLLAEVARWGRRRRAGDAGASESTEA